MSQFSVLGIYTNYPPGAKCCMYSLFAAYVNSKISEITQVQQGCRFNITSVMCQYIHITEYYTKSGQLFTEYGQISKMLSQKKIWYKSVQYDSLAIKIQEKKYMHAWIWKKTPGIGYIGCLQEGKGRDLRPGRRESLSLCTP